MAMRCGRSLAFRGRSTRPAERSDCTDKSARIHHAARVERLLDPFGQGPVGRGSPQTRRRGFPIGRAAGERRGCRRRATARLRSVAISGRESFRGRPARADAPRTMPLPAWAWTAQRRGRGSPRRRRPTTGDRLPRSESEPTSTALELRQARSRAAAHRRPLRGSQRRAGRVHSCRRSTLPGDRRPRCPRSRRPASSPRSAARAVRRSGARPDRVQQLDGDGAGRRSVQTGRASAAMVSGFANGTQTRSRLRASGGP